MERNFFDIVIVGAGISGLMAARELTEAGLNVIVIDKGRGAGGRMAYRRIGDAVFDHGAQYISTRSAVFQEVMKKWHEGGIAALWSRGFPDLPGNHPRWRGVPHMKAIPCFLAQGLNLLSNAKMIQIHKNADDWELILETGERCYGRALIMTPPVPQCVDLLGTFFYDLSDSLRAQIERLSYHRCFAVMAVLDGASGLTGAGVKTFTNGSVAWMVDNQVKGISPVPCVTLHASHDFSLARWDEDRQQTAKIMLDEAAPWIAAKVTDFQIHGWRYSKPAVRHDDPFLLLSEKPYLALAGDAFGGADVSSGANVEGAARSGWSVAKNLIQQFSHS